MVTASVSVFRALLTLVHPEPAGRSLEELAPHRHGADKQGEPPVLAEAS